MAFSKFNSKQKRNGAYLSFNLHINIFLLVNFFFFYWSALFLSRCTSSSSCSILLYVQFLLVSSLFSCRVNFSAYLIPGKNRLHLSLFICVNAPPAKYCIQRLSETTVHLLVFLICVHILLEALFQSLVQHVLSKIHETINQMQQMIAILATL